MCIRDSSSGELIVISAKNSGIFSRLSISTHTVTIKGYIEVLAVGRYRFSIFSPLKLRIKIIEVMGAEN